MEPLQPFLPLIYGAGVVVFHAYGRFNEASYDTRMGLQRLNSLLSVSQMRTASVVRLSLLYYIVGLLAIYLLASAYVLLFSVSIDLDPAIVGGFAPEPVHNAMGADGIVFLGVALAVVGLGPNIPYVRNIEAWLRRSAHGLAGIPTRVLAHTRELLDKDFANDKDQQDFVLELLPSSDRELIEPLLERPDEAFLRDIMLIAAVDAWILNSSSIVGESRLHNAFGKLEEDLRRRKRDMFAYLEKERTPETPAKVTNGKAKADEIAAKPPEAPKVPAGDQATGQNSISVRTQADELGDDICVLLALYREHGLLKHSDSGSGRQQVAARASKSRPKPLDAGTAWQYSRNRRRRDILNDFVDLGVPESQFDQIVSQKAMLALSWTFGAVMVLSLVWSIWPGIWEQQIRFPDIPAKADLAWGQRLAGRVTEGLLSFFLPVAFGIGIWQGATVSGRWSKAFHGHWTRALPWALLILTSCWIVGTFFSYGASLWAGAMESGWQKTSQTWFESLVGAFEFHAPNVVRGALLAVLVVGCLDRWQQERAPSLRTERKHSLMAAVFVGLTGGVARLHMNFSEMTANENWPAAYRAGAALYTGLYSSLIAFCVIFALSNALRARTSQSENEVPVWPPAHLDQPVAALRTGISSSLIAFCVIFALSNALRGRTLPRKKVRPRSPAPTDRPAPFLFVVSLGAMLCLLPFGAIAQQIVIGVRDNARPYVWIETTAEGHLLPKGYLGEVCALLAANAALTYKIVSVDASGRDIILNGGLSEIDLLCDPTTVTVNRLENFQRASGKSQWHISPILHLANRGYLDRIPEEKKTAFSRWKNCIKAYLSREEAPETLGCIRLKLDRKIDISPVNIAVIGTTSALVLNCNKPDSCILAKSHEDAAKKFCTYREPVRYHGDAELIQAAVRHWDETHPTAPGERRCASTPLLTVPAPSAAENLINAGETSSARNYEPYVLVFKNSNDKVDDLGQRLTLALYRLASNGRLRLLLESHFPDAEISSDLDSLFRILSIPAGPVSASGGQAGVTSSSGQTASSIKELRQ